MGNRGRQYAWRDLPRQASFVLAPYRFHQSRSTSVPSRLGRRSQPGTRSLVMLERRPSVKPKARDAYHRELDCQDIVLLARGIIASHEMDSTYRAVRERLGVKRRSIQRSATRLSWSGDEACRFPDPLQLTEKGPDPAFRQRPLGAVAARHE